MCAELLVDGVDVILGNGLAEAQLWTKGPLPHLFTQSIPSHCQPEDISECAVYPVCAVTRTMTRVQKPQSPPMGKVVSVQKFSLLCLMNLSLYLRLRWLESR